MSKGLKFSAFFADGELNSAVQNVNRRERGLTWWPPSQVLANDCCLRCRRAAVTRSSCRCLPLEVYDCVRLTDMKDASVSVHDLPFPASLKMSFFGIEIHAVELGFGSETDLEPDASVRLTDMKFVSCSASW